MPTPAATRIDPMLPPHATATRAAHPAVDTVVFDLGGVLVDWDPRYLYRTLFDDKAAMERFLAEVCTPAWNLAQDAGRPWAEAVATLSAQHPAFAREIAAFHARWPETLRGPIQPTVDLLARLRDADVRLYALTNWSQETFPHARERFDFLDWFAGIVVSGEERLVKPDPEIYRRLIRRYAIDPARALYIDDSAKNVAAAEALGMHGWHFRGADGLRTRLQALGLPV
ncbi:MAG: HAD family phosphatase [Xanthomonadaceae bacterium]|nr:HAD family phosphatase [Xanthomonadaceae bacterium]